MANLYRLRRRNMKKAKVIRFGMWAFVLASLALVSLVWAQSTSTTSTTLNPSFGLSNFHGRFVSAETAEDVSTEHLTTDGSGNVGPPIFFAATAVMLADGNGNVCGESDGFYGGTPPPGVNLGPNLFHGTYTVEAATGRITILTASDGAPSLTNVFCGTTAPIDTTGKTTVFKTQVGYLQSRDARRVTTAEQINASDSSKGGCCATTGFLVHPRVWQSRPREQDSEGPF
jgi:hypothetical protein